MIPSKLNDKMSDGSLSTVTGTTVSRGKGFLPSLPEWRIFFEINGEYRMHSSTAMKLLIALLLLFITTTIIYHCRICVLETDRDAFMSQLVETRKEIEQIRRHVILPDSIEQSGAIWPSLLKDNQYDKAEAEQSSHSNNRIKRAAPYDNTETQIIRTAEDVANLSRNVSLTNNNQSPQNKAAPSKSSIGSRFERSRKLIKERREPRAVYIIPTAPNVDITKPQLEIIGPWYIAQNGADFGFNDLWYKGLSLDYNQTSIVFKESGLYLIYSQIYYHLTLGRNEEPVPMGYRIYLRKSEISGFRRPIPIAECVPSYPSTYYQTCFTQVAWFMEAGDQIFLEHFANSFPMIEADSRGKTFVGIVKLSG